MSDDHFIPLYEQINPGYWVDIFSSDIDLKETDIKNYHQNLVVNVFHESGLPDPSTFNHLTNNLLIIRTSDPPLWVIVYFAENGPIFFNPNFEDIRSFGTIYDFVSVLDQRAIYQTPFLLMTDGAKTSGYYCLWAVGVISHINKIEYFDKIIKNIFSHETLTNDWLITDII